MNIAFDIVNVVAKATLEREVDLVAFQKNFPLRVKYGPNYYGGRFAHFKSKRMQGRVAVWHSGKILGLGTRTPERAVMELRMVAKALTTAFEVEPNICNIVATADLGFEIDLDTCHSVLNSVKGIRAIYDAEQFPGIIAYLLLPPENRKVCILLFSSGKVVCPGFKNRGDIHTSLERLLAVLIRTECIHAR